MYYLSKGTKLLSLCTITIDILYELSHLLGKEFLFSNYKKILKIELMIFMNLLKLQLLRAINIGYMFY